MNRAIEIEEKYSKFWPLIAITSGLAAVILFIYYLSVEEVLLEGYLRLISFTLFALMILSLFKVKDGKVIIRIEISDRVVSLHYSVRDRMVYEEDFQINEIEELKVDEMPNMSLYNDFSKNDRTVRIKKRKTDGWLYLAQLYGRVIPMTKDNAERVANFIAESIREI